MSGTNPNAPPRSNSILNPADALRYLEEYPRGDGLSLQELMDSRKNGGLTYNDFLILPGHINFPASDVSLQSKWVFFCGRNYSGFLLTVLDEGLLGTLFSTPPSSLLLWTPLLRTGETCCPSHALVF